MGDIAGWQSLNSAFRNFTTVHLTFKVDDGFNRNDLGDACARVIEAADILDNRQNCRHYMMQVKCNFGIGQFLPDSFDKRVPHIYPAENKKPLTIVRTSMCGQSKH